MITVIGLDKDGVYLEDIRVAIPYRVAVTVPATQMNSRDLGDALNQRRLFQLQGALPAGAVFRGSGAVPGRAAPTPTFQPSRVPQNEEVIGELYAENARLKKALAEKENLNTDLQKTLSVMAGQLTSIQGVLETLKSQGVSVLGAPVGPPRNSGVDDDVPMFIPFVKRDDIVTNIVIQGQESSADLDASKTALKALRKSKS